MYTVHPPTLINTIHVLSQALGVTSLDNQLFVRHSFAKQQIEVYVVNCDILLYLVLRAPMGIWWHARLTNVYMFLIVTCVWFIKLTCGLVLLDIMFLMEQLVFRLTKSIILLITCPTIIADQRTQGSLIKTVNIDPAAGIAKSFKVIHLTNDQWTIRHATTVVNATGALVSHCSLRRTNAIQCHSWFSSNDE